MPETDAKPEPQKRTVLIVDDHPVLRRGLAALIGYEPDLTVCGEADSCAAALECIREFSPHLVIVDLSLDGRGGLDLVKDMTTRHPEIPALVLSMHEESLYAERCLRAGARGYVSKQQLDTTLLIAIRCALDGGTYMSDSLKDRLAVKYIGGKTLEDSPLEVLSDRELQVFRLIGEGQSTRRAAKTLNLSIKTIESHIEHIKQKLTLESATQLVHLATEWVCWSNESVDSPSGR
jgi:DNA-binding NarL/FixJ family response regulator